MTKFSFWSLALLTGVGCTVVACSSDDDSSPATGGTGGRASAGAPGAAGAPEGGSAGEGGSGGLPGTLYERLGEHAGIHGAIAAIVSKELMDEDIASYFAPNLQDPKHKPTPADIEECFTDLLGSVAGGDEIYPSTLDDGYTCRSMVDAHSALHIGSTTFDHFVAIAGVVLTDAKVAPADIATIAGVLVGTKGDIVDANAPASGPCISPACEVGEGGSGGAAGAAN